MSDNANSVNIESSSRRYHHGDLREALVAEGMKMLAERSAEQLSLREIARRAGVSATAVYRHFPDKQALLLALCKQGSDLLEAASKAAMATAGGGRRGFDETGKAYVRFALAHPSLFRLMMTMQSAEGTTMFENPAVEGALSELRNNVAALFPAGASAQRQAIAAIHAWSLVHGMAMLMLDGQIPAEEAIIESISSPEVAD